jgi:hypothetical protein
MVFNFYTAIGISRLVHIVDITAGLSSTKTGNSEGQETGYELFHAYFIS